MIEKGQALLANATTYRSTDLLLPAIGAVVSEGTSASVEWALALVSVSACAKDSAVYVRRALGTATNPRDAAAFWYVLTRVESSLTMDTALVMLGDDELHLSQASRQAVLVTLAQDRPLNRAIGAVLQAQFDGDLYQQIASLLDDPNPSIRAEVAIALRDAPHSEDIVASIERACTDLDATVAREARLTKISLTK
ncbi:MAG: hypothetical protein ACF8NJ_03555 [Phycisphaerales bacterium JB038]